MCKIEVAIQARSRETKIELVVVEMMDAKQNCEHGERILRAPVPVID